MLAGLKAAQAQEMAQMRAHAEVRAQIKAGTYSAEQAAETKRLEAELALIQQNYDQQLALLDQNEKDKQALRAQYASDTERATTDSEKRMTGIKQSENEARIRSGVDGMVKNLQMLETTGKRGEEIANAATVFLTMMNVFSPPNDGQEEHEQQLGLMQLFAEEKQAIQSQEQEAELQRRDEQLLRMQENYDQQLILVGDNEIARAKITNQFTADKEATMVDSEQRMTEIKNAEEDARLKTSVNGMLGNLQALASTGKKGAQIAKAAAIGQATIKTYESATNAYSALAGIPIIGPALGVAAAAAAIAAGMANVAQIKSQPISGARALGGPVGSGQTYLVGEQGPELFTPGASGQITSNDNLHKALNDEADASAGSATVQNTDVNINITAPDRDSVVEALMAERDLITSMVQMALADQGRDL